MRFWSGFGIADARRFVVFFHFFLVRVSIYLYPPDTWKRKTARIAVVGASANNADMAVK